MILIRRRYRLYRDAGAELFPDVIPRQLPCIEALLPIAGCVIRLEREGQFTPALIFPSLINKIT